VRRIELYVILCSDDVYNQETPETVVYPVIPYEDVSYTGSTLHRQPSPSLGLVYSVSVIANNLNLKARSHRIAATEQNRTCDFCRQFCSLLSGQCERAMCRYIRLRRQANELSLCKGSMT